MARRKKKDSAAASERFARAITAFTGTNRAFFLALGTVVVWAATGPLFRYSDTWQLVINTATTIITFLMVFVIQNTQIRDTIAMQIKLDELIRVTRTASNKLLDLEELDDRELESLRQTYEKLAQEMPHHGARAGRKPSPRR